MQPLGRGKVKFPTGKWKIKENGKKLIAWLEVIITPNKTKEYRESMKEALNELEVFDETVNTK